MPSPVIAHPRCIVRGAYFYKSASSDYLQRSLTFFPYCPALNLKQTRHLFLNPVFSLVAMRVTSSPPQWWRGESRPIMLAAQAWLQRARRQILQDRRCVSWASSLATCVALCAWCFKAGVQQQRAESSLRRWFGQRLPRLAPGEHCIQRRAQRLAPWRQAVIHLRRHLRVDGAQHQAVAF